tara:strand:- start:15 stop:746 length:732 start_codon:yes stop_codon:yes gene_type:complete
MSNMSEIYAKHGQAMGDFIMYSGWVKQLAREYDVVYLTVSVVNYLENVKQLYSDTPNVKINVSVNNVKTATLSNEPIHYTGLVEHENRFDFTLLRDDDSESELYNKVVKEIGTDYILIHYRPYDNMNRRLNKFRYDIVNEKNTENLPIFNLDYNAGIIENYGIKSDKFFDYCKLIENAKQLHFYEGGFSLLADRLLPKDSNHIEKYCHLYAKKEGAGLDSAKWCLQKNKYHKNNWNYITEEGE